MKDIILSLEEIEARGYSVQNNIIVYFDIKAVGYDPRVICIEMGCKCAQILWHTNVTRNLGFIVDKILDVFDFNGRDRGVSISELKNTPCRIIVDKSESSMGRCVGFGHFMYDQFVITDDLINLGLGGGGDE